MGWKEFAEDYGEHPWEHYDDPADYWDSRGDKARARAIRARHEAIERGDIPEEEENETINTG